MKLKNKSTLSFRFFKTISLVTNEEKYGNLNLFRFILLLCNKVLFLVLYKYCYSSFILEPLNVRKIRPKFWKIMGCNIGENVFIGHSVTLDYGNASLINIGNGVSITDNCILLCHRKDISNYKKGDQSLKLPFIYEKIILEDGVNIGKGSIIMPGVRIGEGSVIGAGSVVTKDIPSWCIAVGSPAKIVKYLGNE